MRADLLLADGILRQCSRQAAGIEHADQKLDVGLLEAAGDLAVARDRTADRRGRQQHIIQQNTEATGEPVGWVWQILTGERAEQGRSLGIEREIDAGLQILVVATRSPREIPTGHIKPVEHHQHLRIAVCRLPGDETGVTRRVNLVRVDLHPAANRSLTVIDLHPW